MENKTLKLQNSSKQFYLRYFMLYTAVFVVLAIAVFFVFWKNGISLIHSTDSWKQHYKALIYYSDYLRSIVHNLFTMTRPIIPQWDFKIGIGADVITTFHYYVLGDPLNLLSVFVPADKVYILFQALIVFRFYLSGAAFSAFCFIVNRKSVFGVLAATVTYVFCGYSFIPGLKHPFFMNAMVYLPILLIGVELILKKRSYAFMTVAVAICAMSSFYFFYMLVIMTVVYVLLRLICIYKKDIRNYFLPLVRIAASSVIGVLMSAPILLPVVMAFLSDKRTADGPAELALLYPADFYKKFLAAFISVELPGQMLFLCYSCIALICVTVLFMQKKKNTHLKVMLLLVTGLLMLPVAGKIMNGFSYPTCRWAFIYNFLVAYIVSVVWPYLKKLNKSGLLVLVSVVAVYCVVCLALGKYLAQSLIASAVFLAMTLVTVWLLTKCRSQKGKTVLQSVLLLVTSLSVVINAFLCFSSHGTNYVGKFLLSKDLPAVTAASSASIKKASAGDNTFFRYDGDSQHSINTATINGLNGISYYWSMSNPCIADFRVKTNVSLEQTYKYPGFDNRTALNALAAVKYAYVEGGKGTVPYGYAKTETAYVYENKNALPFGYTYDSYVSQAEAETADALSLQETMLSSAVVDAEPASLNKSKLVSTYREVAYKATGLNHAIIKENRIEVRNRRSKVALDCTANNNARCETYLHLDGIEYYNTEAMPLGKRAGASKMTNNILTVTGYIGDKKVVTKRLRICSKDYIWYEGLTDFDVNLGYHKKPISRVEIEFRTVGTFAFDNISILCQPMDRYSSRINKLKEDTLQNVSFDTNTVSGRISLDKTKLLCMSVPYSTGWKMYIDGEETEPLKVNYMYMGALLDEGTHEVLIKYTTPGLKLGIVLSGFGALSLIGWCVFEQIIKKRKQKD